MKPTPFDPTRDLPPLPFDQRHCEAAARLKEAGLPWRPHVGCFVWDREAQIAVPSPFPQRIYFILNVGHFVQILGSLEAVAVRLVWLPTWHQARLLAKQWGIRDEQLVVLWKDLADAAPGEELLALYELLWRRLTATP